jgi:primosomal protein N' (replication factor Y)
MTASDPTVVRVLVDLPAVDRPFDYLLPDTLASSVSVGTIVRVPLQGRRVRGWVTEVGAPPPPGVVLRPIARVTGLGPSPDLVDLADWAARRWAGRRVTFLRAASPERVVRGVAPQRPPADLVLPTPDPAVVAAFDVDGGVAALRWPPAIDPFPVVVEAVRRGQSLVLVPSDAWATSIRNRLHALGVAAVGPGDWAAAAGGATVVGGRAAAWMPLPDLAAVVAIDEHDERFQDERAPTWHARDVAVERARRAAVPAVVLSPFLRTETQVAYPTIVPSALVERDGWPTVEVIDRRDLDPRVGLYPPRIVDLLRGGGRVGVVYNRTGRARLLACTRCSTLVRCDRCGAIMRALGDGSLACGRCASGRPGGCLACGATRLAVRRPGVAHIRDDVAALTGQPVVELTATTSPPVGGERLFVGTEALLHRVGSLDTVIFLGLDEDLLAPVVGASESVLSLVVLAARRVGQRSGGGRIVVQTSVPDHEVVRALVAADPSRWAAAELERRRLLDLPPYRAVARISGAAADDFIASAVPADRVGENVDVLGPNDGAYLVTSTDRAALEDALDRGIRTGRVRVEVDPLRF